MRLNTAPMSAAIDLYENLKFDTGTARRFVDLLRCFGVVGKGFSLMPLLTIPQFVKFPPLNRHSIGYVIKAVLREGPRLCQCRYRYAAVMPSRLDSGDLNRFVRFYMRAKANAVAGYNVAESRAALFRTRTVSSNNAGVLIVNKSISGEVISEDFGLS